jgi:hypothetical protein
LVDIGVNPDILDHIQAKADACDQSKQANERAVAATERNDVDKESRKQGKVPLTDF